MDVWQTLTVIIASILLVYFLFVFKLNIKIKLHLNLTNLSAYYSIKILFIKLLCGRTLIENNNLIIQNTHNLILKNDKEYKIKQGLFIKQLVKHISVPKIELFFDFGTQNDAYLSSMVCGQIQILFGSICAYILAKNKMAHTLESVSPKYNQDVCEFSTKCILAISLYEIIKSKIIANKQHKENLNE